MKNIVIIFSVLFSVSIFANVEVDNPADSKLSGKAEAPDIIMFSSNQPVCEGNQLYLSVLAFGDSPMTYRWYKDGVQLAGSGYSLIIDHASLADSGFYTVVAINPYGSDSSLALFVKIKPLPVINLGNDTTICVSASITLSAGTTPGNYFWSTMDTGKILTISNTVAGNYTYSVTVSINDCQNSDTINIVVSPCTEVEAVNYDSLCMWPNPANSYTAFVLPVVPSDIEIYNTCGLCVFFCKQIISTVFVADISNLPAGSYVAVIRNKRFYKTMKLIVSRE